MAVNPAVGGGFDGRWTAILPTRSKSPEEGREFTAHPAAPLPCRVRARGAYRATPHPEIHILSHGFGGCSRRRYSGQTD